MPVEVILPKVDMDMSHGIISAWHVAEGEPVEKGAALFDIETDKAAMEVEAPASGRLRFVTAAVGDRVPVGTALAWIYGEGEAADAPPPSAPAPAAASVTETADAATSPQRNIGTDPAPSEARPRATPAARAAARARGIDLGDVPGSGPRGRVQRRDVEAQVVGGPGPDAAPALAPPWLSDSGGALAVSRRKGTGTPIVLIHGFMADNASWTPFEAALGTDRPLVRIELPGHGRSPARPVRGFGELARILVDAFDTATEEPVHLIGHSLGGALALAVADIRPRRIASLGLIAPAGLGPEVDATTIFGLLRATRPESLLPWARHLFSAPDAIDEAYARAAMEARRDPALRDAQRAMGEALFPDGVQAFDLRPALARMTAPTAVLWGRDDRILPYTQVLAARGEFGIHLIEGAGHVPQIERPEQVARIIARHVAGAGSRG